MTLTMKGCGSMTQINFSVKGLIIKDHHFLALHKTSAKHTQLDLPGGKARFEESAEEALIREIEEETNLIVSPKQVLTTWQFVNEDYLIMGVLYLCELIEGDLILSGEHNYYEWLPLDITSATRLNPSLSDAICQLNFEHLQV